MKTILITGCSSGFGLEIAKYFLDRDWKVVATMRTPREDVLPPLRTSARARARRHRSGEHPSRRRSCGGRSMLSSTTQASARPSPFEVTPMATVREVFETNSFGTMAVTQAVLPQFRQRKAGVIVNVTSSVTLRSIPLLSAYTASKAAVNAFTEVLGLELEQFGVRVRLVLPGRSPETRFGENARPRMQGLDHEAYADLVKSIFARFWRAWADHARAGRGRSGVGAR